MYNNWVQLERYETKLVKAVDNCNFYANMIVQRNATVAGYFSISDTMFFVFIGAAALMILYINKTVAKPAKNANDMIAFIDETLQNFYASAERLRNTMAQMAEGIDGINIAVKGEADVNLDISQSLQGEVSRFKNI